MVTEELISYIRSQLNAGIDRNEIVKTLKSQGGWEEGDVADAFAKIGQEKSSDYTSPVETGEELEHEIAGRTLNESFSEENSTLGQSTNSAARIASERSITAATKEHEPNSVLGQVAGKKQSGKKIITTIIFIIVLLGGCAGGVYGYFTYFANPKPLDILSGTIAKGMEVTVAKEKGDFKFGLDIDVNDDASTTMQNFFTSDKMSFNYLVSYDMAYDMSDVANQKVDGVLTFGLEGDTGIMEANFEGTADIKMVDNIIYLRLRDTTPFMELDLSEYEDRWIEIDLENIMPGVSIDVEKLMAMQGEQKEKVKEMLEKLLNSPKIIEIINRSGKVENVVDANGNKEYHLTFQISQEDWKILIKEVMVISKDLAIEMMEEEMQNTVTDPGYEEPSPEEIFTEIENELDSENAGKIFEILENLTAEMWVTKDTMLTRKSVVLLDVSGIKIEDESTGEMKIGVSLSAENETDYDVAVEVVPPTDTTPVQEFIEGLMGETGQTEKKASTKINFDKIRTDAELYYDDNENSYGTPVEVSEDSCVAENTMFTDNTSILWSLKSLRSIVGSDKKLVCTIGNEGQSYAVAAELSDNLWYCIDSTDATYEIDQPLSEGDTTCPEGSKKLEEVDW